MTRLPSRRAAGVAVGTAWLAFAAVSGAGQPPSPAQASGGPSVAVGRVVGATSCAAAACHGGDRGPGTAGSEHTTWAEYDPHGRAFSVLFQERSAEMVRLLAAGAGEPALPAHRTGLCLRCHGAAPANLDRNQPLDNDVHRSASCENCHGAAGNWLTTHYTRPWQLLSAHDKATRHGMLPTKDLRRRARVCAGCHVGEPGREVDHRLIAAGHPALRFEFAAYQADPLYTKHWREEQYGPDAEAWAWLIGQVETARAAADLLRHRAAEAADRMGERPARDWPELAEYTCFSCHQNLAGPFAVGAGARSRAEIARPGSLPWGSWSYPVPLSLAGGPAAAWWHPSERPAGVIELVELFRRTDRPDPRAAAAQAAVAAADLERWSAELQSAAVRRSAVAPLRPDELRAALRHVIRYAGGVPTTDAPSTDWDRFAQSFLAAAALYRALCAVDPVARDQTAEADLRSLATELRFPRGRDGPPTADGRANVRRLWADLAAHFDPEGRP